MLDMDGIMGGVCIVGVWTVGNCIMGIVNLWTVGDGDRLSGLMFCGVIGND